MNAWLEAHGALWQAWAGIATVVAALVAVATLWRAGRDSSDRTRPYVVVELRAPEFSYKRLDLVVRNAGATAARSLRVEFTPPFEDSGDRSRLASYAARRYAGVIDTLAPGQELTSILIVDTDDESQSDLPPELVATVRYSSRRWRRDFRDTFVLQRFAYEEQVFSESSGSVRKRLGAIADTLKDSAEVQARTGAAVDRISEAIVVAAQIARSSGSGSVEWATRSTSEHGYDLINVGGGVALNPVLTAAEEHRVRPRASQQVDCLPPGSSMAFTVIRTLASGRPRVRVNWEEDAGEDGTIPRHCELDLD